MAAADQRGGGDPGRGLPARRLVPQALAGGDIFPHPEKRLPGRSPATGGAGAPGRALALYLVIAWRILHLVTLGRDCPELPCDVAFSAEEWRAAWLVAKRQPPPETPPPLGEMVRIVAGFGGFLGPKGDGHPGPKALWEGLLKLMAYVEAFQVAHEVYGEG